MFHPYRKGVNFMFVEESGIILCLTCDEDVHININNCKFMYCKGWM